MPDLRRSPGNSTSPANFYKPASIAYNAVFAGNRQDKACLLPVHLRFTEQAGAASRRQTVRHHMAVIFRRMQDSVTG